MLFEDQVMNSDQIIDNIKRYVSDLAKSQKLELPGGTLHQNEYLSFNYPLSNSVLNLCW